MSTTNVVDPAPDYKGPGNVSFQDQFVCLADVARERVEWLWFPYIPLGKCTVIDGDPGQGKSFLTTKLAACLSRGEKLPGMDREPQPVKTIMLAHEDGAGDTIRPRLEDCGGELKHVFVSKKRFQLDAVGLKKLKAGIERRGANFVSIDPLNSYLPKDVRINDNAAMRQFIDTLCDLAAETGAAILIVRHLNKGQGKALQRGAGVMDTIGGCRSALFVSTDLHDKSRSVMSHSKHNLTKAGPSLAFRITDEPKFVWDGTSDLQADDLAAEPESAEDRGALASAVEFLKQELADGPVLSTWLFPRGEKEGHAQRTIRRASDELKVVKRKAKKGEEHEGRWLWSLPEQVVQATGSLAVLDKLDKLDTFPTLH